MERGLCRLMPWIWDVFSETPGFDFSDSLSVGHPCTVLEVEPTCLVFSVLSC